MLVDMHCHIIYGVDDGAQTEEDMHRMLDVAHENEVRHIIATSHIEPGHKRFPAETYISHLQKANDYCREMGYGIDVHVGSEIMYTDVTPRLLHEGNVPTLDRTWTVLVEFLPDVKFKELCEAARDLGNEGMQVVFAHIERYQTLRTSVREVRELKEDFGVMMQMNCGTVLHKLGFMGERWKRKVLEDELIDMVASDAHNTTSRCCNVLKCHQTLTEMFDRAYADRLCGGCQAELFGLEA